MAFLRTNAGAKNGRAANVTFSHRRPALFSFLLVGTLAGCGPFLLYHDGYLVNGTVLASKADVRVTGRLLAQQEEIEFEFSSGAVDIEEDGSFTIGFWDSQGGLPGSYREPNKPAPDQVEIVLVLDGCQQRVVVDIDPSFIVDTEGESLQGITLAGGIVVEECEP